MHLQQEIARTPGVGNTQIFGQRQYAMRIWLDPVRMTALGIAASDVIAAIQAQNIQAAAGQIGAAADRRRPAAADHRAGAGPAERSEAVRRHRGPHQSERRDRPHRRHRAGGAGGAAIHRLLGARRVAVGDARGVPGAELQRAGGRQGDRTADGGRVEAIPARPEIRDRLQRHQLRQRQHPRDPGHPGHHPGPGGGGCLRVPPRLAGDLDPHHRDSGLADRRVRDPLSARLLGEHGEPVRDRAGDHAGGRRCDRGRGERDPHLGEQRRRCRSRRRPSGRWRRSPDR